MRPSDCAQDHQLFWVLKACSSSRHSPRIMDFRVESHAQRNAVMNVKRGMFQAGLSNKFTKRHITNFHDTTLTAASAAKARAELKMERQATAIEKQQQKIEDEMKKIEAITEKLQRQQAREAKRLRNRLSYAANRIQIAFRSHVAYEHRKRGVAATQIQRHWRGCCGRRIACGVAAEQERLLHDVAARTITRNIRVFACRVARRHEIRWRAYAATTIQATVRRYQARLEMIARRLGRDEMERRHRSAVVIQSHTRGFLTRLVYMDILYLVCRIQSVVRGFLVRKRLRWLLSLNLRAIIQLQAVTRGFLVRRTTKPMMQKLHGESLPADTPINLRRGSRIRRASKPLEIPDAPSRTSLQLNTIRSAPKSPSRQTTYALATMAAIASPVASPPTIKRSFWLPSGAGSHITRTPIRHRLPQLHIKRPLASLKSPSPTLAAVDSPSSDDAAFHAVTIQRKVRGKIAKQRPPVRLEPLLRPREPVEEIEVTDGAEAVKQAADERREREETIAKKLLARKIQEKKRQELEAAVRHQRETEETERRQMAREEKLTRLLMKTAHRKHRQSKKHRQTLEQQREESERVEMIREERLVRLHLKRIQRLVQESTLQRRGSRKRPALDGKDSNEESDEEPAITRDRREEDERVSNLSKARSHVRLTQKAQQSVAPVSHNSKPPKQRVSKPSGLSLKKTRELCAVYGGSGSNNQAGTKDDERSRSRDVQEQYASWNFHIDDLANQADLVEDDAEFDYGNDFDEVIEETKLTRLIC